jgi:hypothetical protein
MFLNRTIAQSQRMMRLLPRATKTAINSMALSKQSRPARSFAVASADLPYVNGMDYGMGVDLLGGGIAGSAVKPDEIAPIQNLTGTSTGSGGQTVTYNFLSVNSMEQIFQNITAGGSITGNYSKVFSANASGSKIEESMFNSQSSFILASAVVKNSFRQFKSGILEDQAVELIKKGTKPFKNAYGDMFVRGFLMGGEFHAIIAITSESLSEQEQVSAKVKAKLSYFGSGGNVKGFFNEIKKESSSKLEVHIYTLQKGGEGEGASFIGDDFDKLMERMTNFPKMILENPVPIAVQAASYETLDNYPRNISPLDISIQAEALNEYLKIRKVYLTMKNDIAFIQQHPEYYKAPPEMSILNAWQNELAEKITALNSQITLCSVDVTKCPSMPSIIPPDIKMPERISGPADLDHEESARLGTVWNTTEGSYKGVWSRRGQSRTFDAVFTPEFSSPARPKAELEIRIKGNAVVALRKETDTSYPGKWCSYQGVLGPDGSVSGTFQCERGSPNESHVFIEPRPWQATISGQRELSAPSPQ